MIGVNTIAASKRAANVHKMGSVKLLEGFLSRRMKKRSRPAAIGTYKRSMSFITAIIPDCRQAGARWDHSTIKLVLDKFVQLLKPCRLPAGSRYLFSRYDRFSLLPSRQCRWFRLGAACCPKSFSLAGISCESCF